MATAETAIVADTLLKTSPLGARLAKNVRGLFYTLDKRTKTMAGLQVPGSGDLVGPTQVVVTRDMVGKKIAVYTELEVKTPTGRVADNQHDRMKFIQEIGGISGVIRSADEAVKIIQNWRLTT